jgi:hypothetical protein
VDHPHGRDGAARRRLDDQARSPRSAQALDQGLAKDPSLAGAQHEVEQIKDHKVKDARYESTYEAVFAAIIGERWVDIAGFNVSKAMIGKYNCFYNVSQEPVDVQYDHFIRRYDDRGGSGGVDAAVK